MLGRFLEVSVSCPDVLESIHAFEALGFREIPVGDVWSHPYAVVSDGRLNIGLHRYDFDSPSLTFVQSDLQKWRDAYRVQASNWPLKNSPASRSMRWALSRPAGR
jgi:hypothetical protein